MSGAASTFATTSGHVLLTASGTAANDSEPIRHAVQLD
jgi:hypothetical protein